MHESAELVDAVSLMSKRMETSCGSIEQQCIAEFGFVQILVAVAVTQWQAERFKWLRTEVEQGSLSTAVAHG